MSYLKVCVLRSSSSGNCTAIWTAESGILIDCAGIGLKEIEKDLREIKLDPFRIKGIVITHERGKNRQISRLGKSTLTMMLPLKR